jgi:hypothetical protein
MMDKVRKPEKKKINALKYFSLKRLWFCVLIFVAFFDTDVNFSKKQPKDSIIFFTEQI